MSLGQDGPPTRTRLPETHSGPGGGTRRQPRSSRNLVTVVGVVVVLIAAIAFANRGGGTSSGGGSGNGGNSGGNSGAGTQAEATAPTGDKPVTGQAAGIAKGFAQSQQGAQSAAANYAVALGSDGMFRTDSRHAIVAAIHDPAVVGKLQGEFDKAYSAAFLKDVGLNSDGSAPNGLTFVSRTVPVGTKVTGYSGSSATVEVWSTALGGLAGQGSTKPVSTTWFTLTEQLAWVNGDWKIESSSQKQGPAPVSGDDQAAGADEIANAVNGYGGFTYAR